MDNSLREKLSKIYALVNNGGTDGEKQAAKNILDKILLKYNLDESLLKDLDLSEYYFKYVSKLDEYLLLRILKVLTTVDKSAGCKITLSSDNIHRVKLIRINMTYLEWVTVESAYEYYKRHMKAQYKITCSPIIARCRTSKTKLKKRKELEVPFFNKYCIASNLYKNKELKTRGINNSKELATYVLLQNIEGGTYNRQLTNNLLLNN